MIIIYYASKAAFIGYLQTLQTTNYKTNHHVSTVWERTHSTALVW